MRFSSLFMFVGFLVANFIFSVPLASSSEHATTSSGDPKNPQVRVLKVWRGSTPGGVRLFVRLRIKPEPVSGKSVLLRILVNGKKKGTVRVDKPEPIIVLPFLPPGKDRIAFVVDDGRPPDSGSGEDASGLCDDAGNPVQISPGVPSIQVVAP